MNASSGVQLAITVLGALSDVMTEIVPLIALLNTSSDEVPDEELKSMRDDANYRTNAALQRLRGLIDKQILRDA